MTSGKAVGIFAVFVALFFLFKSRFSVIKPSNFFRPDLVAGIADRFPKDEDGFILACWNYVGTRIPYEHVSSDMIFSADNQVRCDDCYLPATTLQRVAGNCVAKSSLLASLLVTRLPEQNVHIIVGSYSGEELGGHAWVEVWRQGNWYLLESTLAPDMGHPWMLADSSYPQYDPGVLITMSKVVVEDKQYIQGVAGCNCAKD